MEYLKLIKDRVLGPTWANFLALGALSIPVADAIFGETKPVQYIAWIVFALAFLIFAYRLLKAPYAIWLDDRATIKKLKTPSKDPLADKKKRLSSAASSLYTTTETVYASWLGAVADRRSSLEGQFNERYRRTEALLNELLHHEEIYRAGKACTAKCAASAADVRDGAPNANDLIEARNQTRKLLRLLAPTGEVPADRSAHGEK